MAGEDDLDGARKFHRQMRDLHKAISQAGRQSIMADPAPLDEGWLNDHLRMAFQEGLRVADEKRISADFDTLDWRQPEHRIHFRELGSNDQEVEQHLLQENLIPANVVAYQEALSEADFYEEAARRADWEAGAELALGLMQGVGLNLSDLDFRRLCVAMVHLAWELNRHVVAHCEGRWEIKPVSPIIVKALTSRPEMAAQAPTPTPHQESRRPTGKASKPLSAAVEGLLKEKTSNGGKFLNEYELTARLFEEICGAKTIDRYTKSDVVKFKDSLMVLPQRHRQFFKTDALSAIKANETRKLAKLDPYTVKRRLVQLRTMFDWAVENGLCDANPVTVKLARSKSRRGTKRDPFSVDDLQQLFSIPLFVGCQSKSRWTKPGKLMIRDHRYWIPLLALWTGARMGELAQLLLADVREERGILYLDIAETADDDDSDDAAVKTLKNAQSRRRVPIHAELIHLGFRDYLDKTRAQPQNVTKGQLFPTCKRGADGKFSPYSKYFRRVLTAAGITSRRLVFHSFRHAFEDAMREAELEAPIRYRITGRTSGHSEEGYGRGESVPKLKEYIDRINFPGLDLSHLYPAGSGNAEESKS